jgi:NAD(P)-dependent dehydrogenase (short-subunit alcohol dehydrogenase family)
LWEVPADEFDAVIDVNIKGVTNVIRHCAGDGGAEGGVIVNFSSGWGRSTSAEVAPYCATKWAVEGLTQRWLRAAARHGSGALNPGVIDTDMLRLCWSDGASAYQKPERWAEKAVPFLLGLGPKDNGKPLSVPS